jgi:hypothetical protein
MAERLDWKSGLLAAMAVYAGAQLTIAPLIADRIDAVGETLGVSPPAVQGPRAVPDIGSDVCTLLAGAGLRRNLSWLAFPVAGRAADHWRAKYRFVAEGGCRRGRGNVLHASRDVG